MPLNGIHRGGFLARAVEDVSPGPGGASVDLLLRCVAYLRFDEVPGILTGESPQEQGIETRLPNLPELGSSGAETAPAHLRVRFPARDVVRFTFVPRRPWRPEDDEAELGMLVPIGGGQAGADAAAGADVDVDLRVDALEVHMATAHMKLRVTRQPFSIEVRDAAGRCLTAIRQDRRQAAGLPLVPALSFRDEPGPEPPTVSCAFELSPGELVAGLGEHYGPFVKNGQRLGLQADDALGSGTGRCYKAAPVFHSSAGFSAFLHTPGPATADVGATYPGLLGITSEDHRLDLFVFTSPSLRERLRRYTQLTGRATEPPDWALGVWMSRCRYASRREAEQAADGMRAHRVPCDVIHVDPDWLERDKLNCDFAWSERKYPDRAGFFRWMADRGFHVSLWELPYLDPGSPLYAEAAQAGFLVKAPGGTPASAERVITADGRPRGVVDFSNEAARSWWKRLHGELLELGVGAFKTDFGEAAPDAATMSDGRTGRSWRNLYPLWYNRTVFEATAEAPGRVGFVWGRSGWAGSQRYQAQWGGDPESSVAGMAGTIRAGLSWSLSAPGLWGHDIGGFYGGAAGRPSPELYIRWAQFGCLSPLTRFHGLTPREPWTFGEEALRIVREFAELRYRLLPYLASVALEAARFGLPAMRPLCLEAEGHREAWMEERAYMLGPDLLVVPVLDDSPGPATVRFWLPPGTWADYWTGERRAGPGPVVEAVPLDRLPLFVRCGSVIPFGPVAQHTGELAGVGWELHHWPAANSSGAPMTTTVQIGEGEHVYSPCYGSPRPDGSPGAPVSIACQEVAPRATRALAHLPDGTLMEVPLGHAGGS
ncbi:MAG: glycoside hydrolase family 31 protein [Acidimicrobiales bacterium]